MHAVKNTVLTPHTHTPNNPPPTPQDRAITCGESDHNTIILKYVTRIIFRQYQISNINSMIFFRILVCCRASKSHAASLCRGALIDTLRGPLPEQGGILIALKHHSTLEVSKHQSRRLTRIDFTFKRAQTAKPSHSCFAHTPCTTNSCTKPAFETLRLEMKSSSSKIPPNKLISVAQSMFQHKTEDQGTRETCISGQQRAQRRRRNVDAGSPKRCCTQLALPPRTR